MLRGVQKRVLSRGEQNWSHYWTMIVEICVLPRGPFRFEEGEAAVIPNHCEDFTRWRVSNGLVTTPTLLWPESL